VTRDWGKIHPIFLKVAKTVAKPKNARISASEHNVLVHQTNFETLKCLQQTMF
jgi:hypothetical protein